MLGRAFDLGDEHLQGHLGGARDGHEVDDGEAARAGLVAVGGAAAEHARGALEGVLAVITGAEAIHPGYGFLAENAHFNEICRSCNIDFIGPSPEAMAQLGDKNAARNLAKQAGVPVVPGSEGIIQKPDDALRFAHEVGFPVLIKAVAAVESAFNPRAVSVKGAQGLMQLMPATAAQYGVDDPFDPLQNLRGGTHHLRDLLAEFDGDLSLALAAYNAGSAAVRRYGGIPNYPETQAYVKKVHAKMNRVPRRRGSTPATPARAVGEIRRTRQADGSIVFRN